MTGSDVAGRPTDIAETSTASASTSSSIPASRRLNGLSLRYRLSVLSRAVAATAGGYGLATALSVMISRAIPTSRSEGVTTALLLSFAVYAGAVMWAFSARNAWRAWAGLALPTCVAAVAWWLTGGAS